MEKDIDYVSVCSQIKQHVNYSTRLEIVHLLLDLANAGEQVRQKATERFRAINEAYEHIKLLRNIK